MTPCITFSQLRNSFWSGAGFALNTAGFVLGMSAINYTCNAIWNLAGSLAGRTNRWFNNYSYGSFCPGSNWLNYQSYNYYNNSILFNNYPVPQSYGLDTFVSTTNSNSSLWAGYQPAPANPTLSSGNAVTTSTGLWSGYQPAAEAAAATATSLNPSDLLTSENASALVNTAKSHLGNVNDNDTALTLFANGRTVGLPADKQEQWCGDFVSTLVLNQYGRDGIFATFPDARERGVRALAIKEWAERSDVNRWVELPADRSASDVMLSRHCKPGDLLIYDRGGSKGHVAIITYVSSDGKTIRTIDGNFNNTVHATSDFKVNDAVLGITPVKCGNKLIGFVSMS